MSKKRAMDDDLMRIVFGETRAQEERLPPPNYARARARLRALLAVARAAQRQAAVGNNWPKVLRALARLDRLSSGTGKRKARGSRSPEGTETP